MKDTSKDMDFCHSWELYLQIKNILYCYNNRPRCSKTVSAKLVHKNLEAIDEFMGKQISDKTAKAKGMSDMN